MIEENKIKKETSNIYFLFTSIIMILPPLVYGLTHIYFRVITINIPTIGLIMNCVFILGCFLLILLLMNSSKISNPKNHDIRLLIFSLLSNGIIFLFVFQNELKIQNIIDIYISTLSIVILYFIIVNHKYINFELTLLSILFFLFYRFHMAYVHNGLFNQQPRIQGVPSYLRLLYLFIPLVTLIVYLIKIYSYKAMDWFTGIFSLLTLFSTISLIEHLGDFTSKILLTIYLIMPFIFVIDLVVTRFNNRNKLPFYLRITTIVIMIIIFKPVLRLPTFRYDELYQYTFMMYATIFLNIIEHFKLSKIIEVNKKKSDTQVFKLISDESIKVNDEFEIIANNITSTWYVVDVVEENMVLRNKMNPSEVIIISDIEYAQRYIKMNNIKCDISKISKV